ncbi:unnamed protein product [Microthlaspi erraticum]|uniref:Serpin domain-containing protein n=1 Tax=Microthlaspi erraticum TaxID=1685480 RepID=A0A6D2JIM4_9BRAS|nr:unnamed protein product [Microthlaspi erraticum]
MELENEQKKKQNDVAMFLTERVISAVATNSNFVFSPASINAVLTMVAATTENETLRSLIFSFLRSSSMDELNAVFREVATIVLDDGSESGGSKVTSVNGVWVEQTLTINPSSKDLLENFFKAAFSQVDFLFKAEEVRKEVNSWAARNTSDLIKEILPPRSVSSYTTWIYGNALYFKGAWEHKFDKSLTRDKEFQLLNGTCVSVPFMSSSRKRQYASGYDGFKVLRLPFEQSGDANRKLSMYFYLPDAKDGLDDLVKRMASTSGFLDSYVPSQARLGEFRIPKFKIEFGFEASRAFNELELEEARLFHKACVEMDEDGAEAAAVTGKQKKGYRFKDARCPCFFRVRRGRENAPSQCSSTRRYGAEVTHAILPGKARTTFNKRCRKVKEVGDLMTGEPATEAPVNGGRNYNGPKVAKFLVG